MTKQVMEIILIINGDLFEVPDLFKDKYNAEMVTSDYSRSGKRVIELTIPEEE
jgi:hypothetical protein